MSSHMVMSTETEFGIYAPEHPGADPVDLSCRIVDAYSALSRRGTPTEGSQPVRWDYTAEDPLNDLRGMRLSRAAADPSMLTDDPYHLAPSGGSERLPLPRQSSGYLPAAVSSVLTNGSTSITLTQSILRLKRSAHAMLHCGIVPAKSLGDE